MKMIKRFFKWYVNTMYKAYKPCIDAGINPWI